MYFVVNKSSIVKRNKTCLVTLFDGWGVIVGIDELLLDKKLFSLNAIFLVCRYMDVRKETWPLWVFEVVGDFFRTVPATAVLRDFYIDFSKVCFSRDEKIDQETKRVLHAYYDLEWDLRASKKDEEGKRHIEISPILEDRLLGWTRFEPLVSLSEEEGTELLHVMLFKWSAVNRPPIAYRRLHTIM